MSLWGSFEPDGYGGTRWTWSKDGAAAAWALVIAAWLVAALLYRLA